LGTVYCKRLEVLNCFSLLLTLSIARIGQRWTRRGLQGKRHLSSCISRLEMICFIAWKKLNHAGSFCGGPLQHTDLVAQGQVLEFHGGTRTQNRSPESKECLKKKKHQQELCPEG